MFNNFWSNNTVKWFWFLVSEFLHCCTLVLYSVSHHWIMWRMSQCCVNITCRSINSCYFCSKSCKWLLRIKKIKILNTCNYIFSSVSRALDCRAGGMDRFPKLYQYSGSYIRGGPARHAKPPSLTPSSRHSPTPAAWKENETPGTRILHVPWKLRKWRYFPYPANSFPLPFLFLPHFFSFAGHLVGFILVERFLGKLLGSWH